MKYDVNYGIRVNPVLLEGVKARAAERGLRASDMVRWAMAKIVSGEIRPNFEDFGPRFGDAQAQRKPILEDSK